MGGGIGGKPQPGHCQPVPVYRLEEFEKRSLGFGDVL